MAIARLDSNQKVVLNSDSQMDYVNKADEKKIMSAKTAAINILSEAVVGLNDRRRSPSVCAGRFAESLSRTVRPMRGRLSRTKNEADSSWWPERPESSRLEEFPKRSSRRSRPSNVRFL